MSCFSMKVDLLNMLAVPFYAIPWKYNIRNFISSGEVFYPGQYFMKKIKTFIKSLSFQLFHVDERL